MSHLVSNTRPFLFFAFIAILLLPNLNLLLPLFIIMILIQNTGVWFFGGKNTLHIGASGLVLAFFSFDVTHGIFAGGWKTAVAIGLLLISGPASFRALTSRGTLPSGAQISVAGHVWGFLSGIFSAYLISPFGPLFYLVY